jgi:hypothetical protein
MNRSAFISWSSYRAYGNYASAPDWLVTGDILGRAGGRERYRRLVQSYVTRGIDPDEFRVLAERLAIGSREFIDRARKCIKVLSPEHSSRSFATVRMPFDRVVTAVEAVKGVPFSDFRDRYGDWGLALVLYLARMHSGLTLARIGEIAGGIGYKTALPSYYDSRSGLNPIMICKG